MRVVESAPCEQAVRPPTDLPPSRFRGRELHRQLAERPFQRMHLSIDCPHEDCGLPFVHVWETVPAQAMDFRNPCRSTSSWLWSRNSSSFFSSDILEFLTHDRFCPSLQTARVISTGGAECMEVAPAASEHAYVHPDRGSARIIPRSYFSLLVRYKRRIVENKIVVPSVLT
jgi:hypothetical protein